MRTVVVLAGLLLLGGCTADDEPHAPSPAERAIDESRELLPDEALRAAIPEGYELDAIKRNDLQFAREGWITVGVRLLPQHLSYARAIFYVLPDASAARQMFETQSGQTRTQYRSLNGPKPSPVEDVDPSLCGGGLPGLWTCHATGGRLYLVTQSGDYPSSRKLDPDDRDEAEELLAAFASLL